MEKNIIGYERMHIMNGEKIAYTISGYSGQHYYPHTLADYAHVIKNYCKNEIPHLPIMAVDSHDCYACDFRCKDCLADETKGWFKNSLHAYSDYQAEFEKYKIALKKIVDYSAECGIHNVRFEMSGEGNPDLYPFRNEIIEYSKKIGMEPVYISSGSKIDDRLLTTLVKYAKYIRISMPGINNESYIKYSGQYRFKFENAIDLIKKLVKMRDDFQRQDDLLIGVRCCLRSDYIDELERVAILLTEDIGVDTFQIVRAIQNENTDNEYISNDVKKILLSLKIKNKVVVPDNLDFYYNRRKNKNLVGNVCFAAKLTPILYSSYLLPCTHTRIIRNLESYINSDLSLYTVPNFCINTNTCKTCCAIKDNTIFTKIYQITSKIIEEGGNPGYICE